MQRAALSAYLARHVVSAGGRFVCRHEAVCRASHGEAFHPGQLHHVGRSYFLARNGKPFRVMVVGMEYGHPNADGAAVTDLDARHAMVMDSGLRCRMRAADGPPRNPHMKGTTQLLRLLFGLDLGYAHDGEFIDVDGIRTHVFDAIAICNFLLCSANPHGSRQGRSTPTMRTNCAPHFVRTVETLAPTLLVCQGVGVGGWLAAVSGTDWAVAGETVGEARIGGHVTTVLALSHPSSRGPSRWGGIVPSPYLKEVVAPLVKRILDQI